MFIKLFLLLLPMLFLTAQAPAQKQSPASSIPRVKFCELTSHPEKYVDKLISTEANYIVWWESSYLYGDGCIDHKIHNNWNCADNDQECQRMFQLEWQKLEPFMRSKKSSDASRVKAVLIGRLVGPGAYGHLDGFRYEFRIISVGKVKAIAESVSWKGL